jgi:hypothetical protein
LRTHSIIGTAKRYPRIEPDSRTRRKACRRLLQELTDASEIS